MGKMRKITIFDILNYTWFALFTLACFFPFYYLFINTISNNDLSSRGLVMFYPRGIHINNYIEVFKIPGLGTAALVSIGRTVIGTLLTVAASGFLGYLFTKNVMWGRKFWYRFLIVTMYFNAGLIPWFLIMLKLGLVNNFLVYIIPGIVAPFNIILVKTFIESTPISLQESAQIDGAGYFTIFWKIVMPLITPILATIAIFSAIGQWNSFQDTLFLVTDPKLFTLQFLLYRFLNAATSLANLIKSSGAINADLANMQTATSIRTTVSMVVVIPILLVYPFFQRYFVKGILIGAVKG
ncbi:MULTISPECIES: carbohydrate ABC transporter permease [unclassified Paenibacillus]|uniref:carbohydrate ABC transporter permease n=1 Tax=unclassified Paenibacillus TaxID=185978 RepID=UPI00278A0D40|nr:MULTISPECIES: carbohydrate ABC transporter permease [unclassified Paenibacillus]MDQ0901107.1 putative aldouronate transport system permease protein [Paenibacillus sp. V4I7]MDQ0920395.1 putative aldouronate transport system permease protein [Paenibacillus sp. V4I5]